MVYSELSNGVTFSFLTVFLYSALCFSCCSSSHSETDAGTYERVHCETSREIVSIEDITPLFYSAQDVIDMLWGTWQCDELEWYDLDSVGVLYPDEKPNGVTVTQSYEGGDIVFINSTRVGGDENTDLSCVSELRVPTAIKLESSDDFFSETLNGTASITRNRMRSIVEFEETPSRNFSGAYDFLPNSELQELPYSGTVIGFGSKVLNESEAITDGYISEYFWSEDSLVDTDVNPTLESWGASFTTVSFSCHIRDIT